MSKSTKWITGISAVALIAGMTGCSNTTKASSPPKDTDCKEWEQEGDAWECEDSGSSHYNHYFYNGAFYNSKSNLNSAIKKSTSSTKASKGFGSGSKSFGG
ncbi:aminotransferase yhxA [Terribacillus saccharophilus]|uniref:aminotransferase yhxA n=1 Tax=Terribacillus saccharophilus TaxID=361277 RepID=UPI003981B0A2